MLASFISEHHGGPNTAPRQAAPVTSVAPINLRGVEMAIRNLLVAIAALVIVGALNWGMVGAAQFDLVAAMLGAGSALSAIVYILVGLAGIYQALQLTVAHRTAQPVVYTR